MSKFLVFLQLFINTFLCLAENMLKASKET